MARPAGSIVVDLDNEAYDQLIVEVADPGAAVRRLEVAQTGRVVRPWVKHQQLKCDPLGCLGGLTMRAEQARDMAAYNQWMNTRLYSVCGELSDAERRRDRGVFFRSIHGTLNHILLADKIWLGRFFREPFQADSLDQELYHGFDALNRAREETDQQILRWAHSLTDEILGSTLRYTSIVNPMPRTYEMWIAVAHFFNHQTHHRGQLTAMLSQCGKDYGVTDIIWLPQVLERNTTQQETHSNTEHS